MYKCEKQFSASIGEGNDITCNKRKNTDKKNFYLTKKTEEKIKPGRSAPGPDDTGLYADNTAVQVYFVRISIICSEEAPSGIENVPAFSFVSTCAA